MKHLICLPIVATLAACGGGGGAMEEGPMEPTGPFIEADPTISTTSRQARVDRFDSIGRSALSHPYLFSPPSGSVTYTGAFIADAITINGAPTGDNGTYGLVGDSSVRVAWAGSRDVSGTFTNINLTEGGTPTEALSGTLSVDGRAGAITTTVFGDVSGVLTGGFDTDSRASVDFDMTYTASARHPNGTDLLAPPEDNLRYIYSDDLVGQGTGGATVAVTSAGFYGDRQ